MLLLIAALLTISVSAFLLLEYSTTSSRQVQGQLRRAGRYQIVAPRDQELAKSAKERLLQPLIERLSGLAMRVSRQGNRATLVQKLQNAGVGVSPQVFLAIKAGLSLSCFAFGLLGGATGNAGTLLISIVGGLLMFRLPDIYVSRRHKKRREEMDRMMPDTLDLLTVSVEAGLGFDSALQKVTEKMSGPLIDEFKITMREIRIGLSRRDALRNMGERTQSETVQGFTRAVIQADELGTSLGRTLRVKSVDMRVTRQLEAEEKAMKAPVKMLFPTVLFIFPAMFIVIIGPAVLAFTASFSGLS